MWTVVHMQAEDAIPESERLVGHNLRGKTHIEPKMGIHEMVLDPDEVAANAAVIADATAAAVTQVPQARKSLASQSATWFSDGGTILTPLSNADYMKFIDGAGKI